MNGDGSDPNGVVLQNIIHDWRDSFELRAGTSIWTSKSFEFFSGVGYTSSAVPDDTFDPALPDFAFASFSLGGRQRLGKHFAVALSYNHLVSVPRDVKNKLNEYKPPTRAPSASGNYSQQIGFFNANLDVKF
jgi:long-subunit fatty acid transport protein